MSLKRPQSILFPLLAACVCAALSATAQAAQNPPQRVSTNATATVEVGGAARRARVRLSVGDTLRVILQSRPGAGLRWRVVEPAPHLLAAGKQLTQSAGQKADASLRQIFSFTAKGLGKGRLVLVLGERGAAAPARTQTLDLVIKPAGPVSKAAIRPEGKRVAKFAGKIPCADCPGIEETIAFYSRRPNQDRRGIYVDRMQYLDRDFTYIEAGRWRRRQGTPADPAATVYSIRGNDSSSRWRDYKVDGKLLVPLGEDGKPIQSPFNLSLHQVE